jgi:hypothetical protein
MEKTIDITVSSLEGVKQVEIKPIDESKGVWGVFDGDEIKQYRFSVLNPAEWTPETMVGFIQKRMVQKASAGLRIIQHSDVIFQSFSDSYEPQNIWNQLPENFKNGVSKIDSEPLAGIGALTVKYGVGAMKQHFSKEFFQKKGFKWEKTTLFINHSNLNEIGNAIPIGTLPKFLGANESGADYAYYVDPSEDKWRKKIKNSVALGDWGYVKRISIEANIKQSDFRYVPEHDYFDFHDVNDPTGIAIVLRAGMKGSKIIS